MTVANILEALVNGHDENQPDKTDGIPHMPMNCGAFTTRFNKITLVDLGIDDPTPTINMCVNACDDGFDDWDDDDDLIEAPVDERDDDYDWVGSFGPDHWSNIEAPVNERDNGTKAIDSNPVHYALRFETISTLAWIEPENDDCRFIMSVNARGEWTTLWNEWLTGDFEPLPCDGNVVDSNDDCNGNPIYLTLGGDFCEACGDQVSEAIAEALLPCDCGQWNCDGE